MRDFESFFRRDGTVRRAPAQPGDYPTVARLAAQRHRPGTMTLVVLNTVTAAQEVQRRLRGEGVTCALLHPRLRGSERAARLAGVAAIGAEVFAELFDTTADIDVSAFLLDGDDLDVELARGRPGRLDRMARRTPRSRYPAVESRCRVPMGDALRFARHVPVWRFDRPANRRVRLGEDPAHGRGRWNRCS